MKKKVAQPAVERKPESEIEEPPTGPATPEDQESIDEEGEIAEEPKAQPQQKLISIKDIFASIDSKKIKMAEGLGIPLEPLMNYMWQQEQIMMKLIEANDKIAKGLEPLMSAIQKSPPQNLGNPTPNSALGGLMQFLPQILGQGSSNPMMDKLQETFMNAGLRSMTLTSRIGESVLEKVTTEMTANVVKSVVEKATS